MKSLVYGGLSKDEYGEIRYEIDENNRSAVLWSSLVFVLLCCVCMILGRGKEGTGHIPLFAAGAAGFAFLAAMSLLIRRKPSVFTEILSCVFLIMALGMGLCLECTLDATKCLFFPLQFVVMFLVVVRPILMLCILAAMDVACVCLNYAAGYAVADYAAAGYAAQPWILVMLSVAGLICGCFLMFLRYSISYTNYLNRRLMVRSSIRIAEKEMENEEYNSFVKILSSDYEAVFKANLLTNSLRIYKQDDQLTFTQQSENSSLNYIETMKLLVEKNVLPMDREEVYEIFSVENMKDILSTRTEFTRVFRNIRGEYTELKVVRFDAEDDSLIMGICVKDAEIREEIRIRERLEMAKSIQVIARLVEDYDYVCYVDMRTREVTKYKSSKRFEDLFGATVQMENPSLDGIESMLNSFVVPEEQPTLRLVLDGMQEQVSERGSLTFRFQGQFPEGKEYCEVKFTQDTENPEAVIMGIQNVNRLVIAQQEQENVDRMMALMGNFQAVYDVDCETGQYMVYTGNHSNVADRILVSPHDDNIYKEIPHVIQHVIYKEDQELFSKVFSRENIISKLQQGQEISLDYRAVEQGKPVWYNAKIVKKPGTNEDRMLIGIFSIQQQRMQEIRYQEQLQQARKQAESANNAKTAFLFSMSHDIRTPLNAITGYTDIARKNIDNPERVEDCLDKIRISGNHLYKLMDNVLDMARIESGQIEITEKPMDIAEHITSVETICSTLAAERQIAFTIQSDDIEHPLVIADELHITQIVLNVLTNAIKYTKPGGSVSYTLKEIQCDRERRYATYQFTVDDTGIGMKQEFLSHAFDPFTRENTSTVSGVEGVGLGLTIVKKLVGLLNGSVSMTSEPGKGTRVVIELPMKLQQEVSSEDTMSEGSDESRLEGLRVLMVEDNEMNREITRDILEEYGIIVEEAEDGDVAVEIMASCVDSGKPWHFDCILMDIQMPKMNGFEATKAIRDLPGLADIHIPIFALTANAFEEDRKKALESGMDHHLAKPIDISKLVQALSQVRHHSTVS